MRTGRDRTAGKDGIPPPDLVAGDFAAFFRACHGKDPFPWQQRFVATVLLSGWPGQCEMPTSSGKTALIDASVFLLAVDAFRKPRSVPIRTAFVVDRRLVVDDAHGRARRVAERLAWALHRHEAGAPPGTPDLGETDPPSVGDEAVLRAVAVRLSALAGPDENGGSRIPLQVAVLRGGLPRDNGWIESPHQPMVVLSTVDNLGSRLLFRGYGVSQGMWPVHAGLLGEDCLVILDEAHLSVPFRQTLRGVAQLRCRARTPLGLPFAVMVMSATLDEAEEGGAVFRIDMDRNGPDRAAAPVLDRRYAAVKRVRLARSPAARGLDVQARAFVRLAEEAAGRDGVRVVGVVVNRVRLARRIHALLAERHGAISADPAMGGSLLLTGRCRPFQRDALLGLDTPRDPAAPFVRVIDRIRTGRDRRGQQAHAPVFVIGTQAIEAGADLDVDALVTEIAPWSSLRQRFGRLDRAGELGETEAVVVCTFDLPAKPDKPESPDVPDKPPAPDPIYGDAAWNTRQWLWTLAGAGLGDAKVPKGTFDMGVDGQAAFGPPPAGTEPDRPGSPFLSPAIMDLFAQTDPQPHPNPDPALWLHGLVTGPADIQVVWRADAPKEADPHAWEDYTTVLMASPPTSSEALSLPIWSARAWLSRLVGVADAADVEATPDEEDAPRKGRKTAGERAGRNVPAVFVWRAASKSELVSMNAVQPGDTVVLPASFGGCDAFGWLPDLSDEPEPVVDVAESAILKARARRMVRLHPETLDPMAWAAVRDVLQRLPSGVTGRAVAAAVRAAVPDLLPPGLGRAPAAAAYSPRDDSLAGGVLLLGPRIGPQVTVDVRPDLLDEDDLALLATGEVRLDNHLEGVRRTAEDACARIGLAGGPGSDVALSGALHDVGKAEVRFRALLRGGDLLAALAEPPLAKGLLPDHDRKRVAEVAAPVSFPKGARHECWSVAMAERSGILGLASDPELVLWLVGTHHGRGRPMHEPVSDPNPPFKDVVFDLSFGGEAWPLQGPVDHRLHEAASGWADRFDRLIARYGWWGLAYLEALVRLSDARRSRAERLMIEETAERDAGGTTAEAAE